jgi:hypothetical protein
MLLLRGVFAVAMTDSKNKFDRILIILYIYYKDIIK